MLRVIFDEMLRQDSIEAVVISSPAVTHFELAKKALLADRDVFIEKPFTLNVRMRKNWLRWPRRATGFSWSATCSSITPWFAASSR